MQFERAEHIWTPKAAARKVRKVECISGGPGGIFPARSGGADALLWQPAGVPGWVLDWNPNFQVVTGLDGVRPTLNSITNNKPGTTDAAVNIGGPGLHPTWEPTGWGGAYNFPSFLGDGVSRYLACTSGLANTLSGGLNTPFTVVYAFQYVSLPAAGAFAVPFFLGNTALVNPLLDVQAVGTGTKHQVFKRSTAGGADNAFQNGGTTNTQKHVFAVVIDATPSVSFYQDGWTTPVFSGALSVGTQAINVLSLLATYANSSPGSFAHGRFARILAFTGALGASDLGFVTSNMMSIYLS